MLHTLDINLVRSHLSTPDFSFHPCIETGSTNDDAKAMAAQGAAEFTVVSAEYQNRGKGRLGRSFYSPRSTGLYFSIILRPDHLPVEDALYITTAAAAATSEAIEAVCGQKSGIKWVNDVFLGSKKVCGILTEASFDLTQGKLAYAVLGIGINIAPPEGGFPEELTGIADSIYTKAEDLPDGLRERLLASILDRFYAYYVRFPAPAFLESYRCRSILLGKTVTVHQGDRQYPAKVLEIDDRCRLVVEQNGEKKLLDSGEVSVRL